VGGSRWAGIHGLLHETPATQLKEVRATAFFRREPGLELLQSFRVVFHAATILPVGAT